MEKRTAVVRLACRKKSCVKFDQFIIFQFPENIVILFCILYWFFVIVQTRNIDSLSSGERKGKSPNRAYGRGVAGRQTRKVMSALRAVRRGKSCQTLYIKNVVIPGIGSVAGRRAPK
jgi:hypothetical protein